MVWLVEPGGLITVSARIDYPAGRALSEASAMSVYCQGHPLALLRPKLAAQGMASARELRRLKSGSRVSVAGLSIVVHTPPTRSGRRVMFVTLEDETGLVDLAVFDDLQETAARTILTSEVLAFEGVLKREGPAGRSMSVTASALIPAWTGKLATILKREPT